MAQIMRQLSINNSKDTRAVQLSVDEAYTNVIQHAYSNQSGSQIAIRCKLSSAGNQFEVRIIGWGKSFDPSAIPESDAQSDTNE